MFCKKCGNPLKEGAKFCGACGTVVQTQAAPASNAKAEASEDIGYTIPLVREEAPVKKAAPVAKPVTQKALPVKKILIAVAAVAVVVLLVVLASSLFGGRTVYLQTHDQENSDIGKYITEYEYDEDGNLVEYTYSCKYKGWYADYLDDFKYSWTYEYEDGRIIAAEYDDNDISFKYWRNIDC